MLKHAKKGHFSKITFHAILKRTFKNIEAKHHKNHHLILKEESP